jgi:transcriptional regulator with XRE-family HTH domain
MTKPNLRPRIAEQIKKSGFTREYILLKFKELEGDEKGVNLQTISNWCTGRSKPNADRLFLLANILRCKVDDLYECEE